MTTTADAATLLAIPTSEPGRLFAGDAAAIRRTWHALARDWHPDRCRAPMADAVFTHLTALRDAALSRLGTAGEDGVLLHGADGRIWRFRPRRVHDLELGTLLVGRRHLAWRIAPGQADLAANGIARIEALPYADAAMRAELAPLLPEVAHVIAGADDTIVVQRRDPELILLRDLLAMHGRLPAPHVAWIVSGLLHLGCYIAFAGLVHGDLSPDTCLIAPASHRVALLGGWWYAAPIGAELPALPLRTADVAPAAVLASGRADPAIDQALIRLLAREIAEPGLPAPMQRWVTGPHGADALAEYAAWQTVLDASFGARRFATLLVTADDIYT